jgi:hypothetical protein
MHKGLLVLICALVAVPSTASASLLLEGPTGAVERRNEVETGTPTPESPAKKPKAEHISRRTRTFLLKVARQFAANAWHVRHPYDIEAVLTTHKAADHIELLEGAPPRLPAKLPVYLIAMRGHFCDKATLVTEAICTRAATVQVSKGFDESHPDRGLEVARVAERYPNLRKLGVPVRLDQRR